jgi:uncharacterized membrane protein YhaH (DUF805 family)
VKQIPEEDIMDFNKLWQNFLDTVTNHYFDLTGRVDRARFWYFVLVEVIVGIVITIVGNIVFSGLLSAVFGLAMVLPNLGMAVRRLQDTGRDGTIAWIALAAGAIVNLISAIVWLGGAAGALAFLAIFLTFGWIVSLVALVAGIALIYFCIQPGTPGDNAYGAPEPAWNPMTVKPA